MSKSWQGGSYYSQELKGPSLVGPPRESPCDPLIQPFCIEGLTEPRDNCLFEEEDYIYIYIGYTHKRGHTT